MLELFFHAGALIKGVLVLLAVLSVVSWTVILYKAWYLHAAASESRVLMDAFQSGGAGSHLSGLQRMADTMQVSPLAAMVKAGTSASTRSREEVSHALRNCQAQEIEALDSYLIILATVGSTAPFIGLLGTVWGIMDAFKNIGSAGSASLAVVAPAIAEALVATAAGLAAAIPAVMAYNFFVDRVRRLTNLIEEFSEWLHSRLTSRPI